MYTRIQNQIFHIPPSCARTEPSQQMFFLIAIIDNCRIEDDLSDKQSRLTDNSQLLSPIKAESADGF